VSSQPTLNQIANDNFHQYTKASVTQYTKTSATRQDFQITSEVENKSKSLP